VEREREGEHPYLKRIFSKNVASNFIVCITLVSLNGLGGTGTPVTPGLYVVFKEELFRLLRGETSASWVELFRLLLRG
jgi:hypothetical protein